MRYLTFETFVYVSLTVLVLGVSLEIYAQFGALINMMQ